MPHAGRHSGPDQEPDDAQGHHDDQRDENTQGHGNLPYPPHRLVLGGGLTHRNGGSAP